VVVREDFRFLKLVGVVVREDFCFLELAGWAKSYLWL
jgi:hypothetical protein